MSIRVFIVDDHPVVLEGLQNALQQEKEMEVLGVSLYAKEALKMITEEVHVVLVDINLPDMNGIDLCKEIKQTFPLIKVIGFSNHNQGRIIVDMLDAHADGYLLKDASIQTIVQAINTVMNNENYIDYNLSNIYRQTKETISRIPTLTKREKEVLKCIVQGLTNQEIAKKLFISYDTVDSHRKHIYSKFDVNNVASLLKFTQENDILQT